jgi:hypothetical protein
MLRTRLLYLRCLQIDKDGGARVAIFGELATVARHAQRSLPAASYGLLNRRTQQNPPALPGDFFHRCPFGLIRAAKTGLTRPCSSSRP